MKNDPQTNKKNEKRIVFVEKGENRTKRKIKKELLFFLEKKVDFNFLLLHKNTFIKNIKKPAPNPLNTSTNRVSWNFSFRSCSFEPHLPSQMALFRSLGISLFF